MPYQLRTQPHGQILRSASGASISTWLLGIQVNNKNRESREKRLLQEMKIMYEELEGKNSEGWKRCNDDILELNDRDLKRRAGRYREFFEQNNEKPTGVFFNLGKEKDGDENTERIKNDNGEKFENCKNTFVDIMKHYIRKRWIDCLRLRIFWEGVLWDCKSKIIGD